jgi:hypothetical protein
MHAKLVGQWIMVVVVDVVAAYISVEVVQARWVKASAKAWASKDNTKMMDALCASTMA